MTIGPPQSQQASLVFTNGACTELLVPACPPSSRPRCCWPCEGSAATLLSSSMHCTCVSSPAAEGTPAEGTPALDEGAAVLTSAQPVLKHPSREAASLSHSAGLLCRGAVGVGGSWGLSCHCFTGGAWSKGTRCLRFLLLPTRRLAAYD